MHFEVEEKSKNEETRNSGIFGFIRRNSFGEREKSKKQKFQTRSSVAIAANTAASRPAVPKRNQTKDVEGENFVNGVICMRLSGC